MISPLLDADPSLARIAVSCAEAGATVSVIHAPLTKSALFQVLDMITSPLFFFATPISTSNRIRLNMLIGYPAYVMQNRCIVEFAGISGFDA
jgi:hypothetical protein